MFICTNYTDNSENRKNLSELPKIMRVANSNMVITGYSDLHFLCMENNVLEIKKLLKETVNINKSISNDSPSWSGFTALHIAVKQGNLKIVQLLLSNGADVNMKDIEGVTPLHLAVEESRWDISELLIKHEADLWAKTVKEMTPLHFALNKYGVHESTKLKEENEKIIHFYVSIFQSKDENFVDDQGISLLHIACIINKPLMVMQLLKKNIPVDICIKFHSPLFPGYTPLHLAVKVQESQIVQILLDNYADYTLMNANGSTSLHLAEELDNFKIIELIFAACYFKVDNPISSEGISHFHIACMRNRIEAVELYIKQNVDVNQPIDLFAKNKLSGVTPLHIAVDQCYIELTKILINHKDIAIDIGDSFGATPLHYACIGSLVNPIKVEIAEMLLKHAADPNSEDLFGRRPIEIAINQENEILLKILLKYNVDLDYFSIVNSFNPAHAVIQSKVLNDQLFEILLNSRTGKNNSIIMYKILSMYELLLNCQWNNRIEMVDLGHLISCLCRNGYNIDCQDKNGKTPLHVAIQKDNVDVILSLMHHGADINITDNSGKTPIQYLHERQITRTAIHVRMFFNFMERILKLKISNSYIHKKNIEWFLKMENFYKATVLKNVNSYAKKLLLEIETMKQYYLSHYTTLFDVLNKTPNQMTSLVKNKILKKFLCSHLEFTEYKDLLLAKYQKGMIWKSLLQPAKDSLTQLLNGLELPDACFEEIFNFLTADDIHRLIESVSQL